MRTPRLPARGFVLLCLVLATIGCRESDGIRTYRVPAEAASESDTARVKANTPTPPPAVDLPPPPDTALQHTPPEGWSNQPLGSMRKASLSTASGAEVTAFVFGAHGEMADTLSNVNRWRGEIALEPTTREELAETQQETTFAWGDAHWFELEGETETTLAAMAVRGDEVWFFKLRGPKAAVEADREAFREWLDSVELPAS